MLHLMMIKRLACLTKRVLYFLRDVSNRDDTNNGENKEDFRMKAKQ